MPVVTIESNKFPEGFPEGTTLRVEWVSGQKLMRKERGMPTVYRESRLVWKGLAEGPFTRNFDKGKYRWKAHKHDPAGIDGFKDWGDFLVGMTQEQFMRITNMQPKMQKAILTTEGVAFHCGFPGCSKRSTGKVSALLHETMEHYGVDLLAIADKKQTESAKAEVDQQIEQTVQQRRGPGRPKKLQ